MEVLQSPVNMQKNTMIVRIAVENLQHREMEWEPESVESEVNRPEILS